jgi:hypothetical protein
MSKKKQQRAYKHTGRTKGKSRPVKSLYVIIPLAALVLLISGGWLFSQRQKVTLVTPAEIEAEIIPDEGDPTSYGLALSLDNTRQFIDYYHTTALTAEQRTTMQKALLPLKAPCCDDNPMATCCCPCNLAKSVWGLSSHLIVEKGYDSDQVQEAALQWLRYIHSNYYVVQELQNNGIDPAQYGLSHEDPCYSGLCELPFVDGGCGGMEDLRL